MQTIRPWAIAKNLETVQELTDNAERVLGAPGRRLFVMPHGYFLTIVNEQQPGETWVRVQHVMPVTRESAEDFWGYRP